MFLVRVISSRNARALRSDEIEKALRFAKRTANSLVVVARPRLRISPKDEPGARSARNNQSRFSRQIHFLPGNQHTTCTHGAVKIRFYRGSKRVSLIGRLSDYRSSRSVGDPG